MLTATHYVYILFVVVIFAVLLMKKDIVIPCILGIFAIGLFFSGDIVFAISSIYNTLIYAGNEFWGVIVIISLVVAMSKALTELGADGLMIAPIKKIMVNETCAFVVMGGIMLAAAWMIWPSPSVALVGAILLPAAMKSGLPAIWAAVAMNLCGHGIALSSDFFIQGAPTITAKAANLSPVDIMKSSLPLWAVMSTVTMAVAFFMFQRDMKKNKETLFATETPIDLPPSLPPKKGARFVAILTPLVFLIDVFILWKLKLTGGDATALVGGTAVVILVLISFLSFKPSIALERVVDYFKEGFGFGIKVFTPVIFIGGFFFLGNESIAQNILGEGATGLLNDISMVLTEQIGLSKISIVCTQVMVAITTGLDGSGFSGLPIVGSLACSLGEATQMNTATLASLGQIITIWVGGGTIIPWAVIPVAAICKVSPSELVRKNFIPVICGIVATSLVALLFFC